MGVYSYVCVYLYTDNDRPQAITINLWEIKLKHYIGRKMVAKSF